MELEAVFTKTIRKYHVKVEIYNTMGNESYGVKLCEDQYVEYGQLVKLDGFNNRSEYQFYADGYIYNWEQYGWDEEDGAGDPRKTPITQDCVFKALSISPTFVGKTVTFEQPSGSVEINYANGGKLKLIPYVHGNDQDLFYKFEGWRDKATGLMVKEDSIVSDNMILEPVVSYRVRFIKNTNGQTITSDQYVRAGEKAQFNYTDTELNYSINWSEPGSGVVDKVNYKFTGWENGRDPRNTPITQDIIFVALYDKEEKAKTYTVNWALEFNDEGEVVNQTVSKYKAGDELTFPLPPTKKSDTMYDYNFYGFYDQISGKFVSQGSKVNSNMNIVAKYTKVQKTYTIKFDFIDPDYKTKVIKSKAGELLSFDLNGTYFSGVRNYDEGG